MQCRRGISKGIHLILNTKIRISAFKWMPGVLSTSVQRPFSFVPLVGSLFTKAKPARDRLLSPASPWHPYLLPALSLFDLSLLSLVSLLISKDVDFVELPRIPRGFLKRRRFCGWLAIYNVSPGRETGSFIRATLLIFNPGRSFTRGRSLERRQRIGISFACRQLRFSSQKNRKIT